MIEANGKAVRDLPDALRDAGGVRHVVGGIERRPRLALAPTLAKVEANEGTRSIWDFWDQAAMTARVTLKRRASASAARRSTSSPAGGRSSTRPMASPTVTLETS